jgi:hypothetical protein
MKRLFRVGFVAVVAFTAAWAGLATPAHAFCSQAKAESAGGTVTPPFRAEARICTPL